MRVRFHDKDGTIYEIDAPEQTTIDYRSHQRDRTGKFLDDLLIVPWMGTKVGLEGNTVVEVAREKILGLRVVKANPARSAPPRR